MKVRCDVGREGGGRRRGGDEEDGEGRWRKNKRRLSARRSRDMRDKISLGGWHNVRSSLVVVMRLVARRGVPQTERTTLFLGDNFHKTRKK